MLNVYYERVAKKKPLKHLWAWWVSRIFDPVMEIPLVLGVAVWYAVNYQLRIRFLVLLLVVDAVLPALYMIVELMRGKISDWDMTKKEERRGLYIFTVFCHFFMMLFAYFLGKIVLAKVLLVFWSLTLVFAIITYYWKISVHAGVNAAALAFFNHIWGWSNYWWLLLILLIVLWARVVIKKHSWAQVIAGSLLPIAVTEIGLRLTGV